MVERIPKWLDLSTAVEEVRNGVNLRAVRTVRCTFDADHVQIPITRYEAVEQLVRERLQPGFPGRFERDFKDGVPVQAGAIVGQAEVLIPSLCSVKGAGQSLDYFLVPEPGVRILYVKASVSKFKLESRGDVPSVVV